jgi:hypothetical protein
MARRAPRTFGLFESLVMAAAIAMSVVACGPATGSAGLPTTACDNAARFASSDPVRSARRLDPVLRDCTSIEDLKAVGAKYGVALAGPDIIGVARTRCRQAGAFGNSLCAAILALPSSS